MRTDLSDRITGGSRLALQAAGPLIAIVLLVVLLLVRPDLVVEVSGVDFFIVTVVLGGGAAWLSGSAIAETWRPYAQVLTSMLLLAAAVRFIHYALFAGTLLSLNFYLVDFAILAALASLGYRRMRVRQMATQYGWIYARRGFLGWTRRAGGQIGGNARDVF